jgi:CrcB protein
MKALALVMVGGSVGAGLRHLVNLAAMRLFGLTFPWATLTVNVVGGFLMGLLAGWIGARGHGGGQDIRLFLATGVLGGFTTFSAFSLDAVTLWERGSPGTAVGYVALSVAFSIVALAAGLALARGLS